MSITIHRGSLLEADTDCIVNPANLFLRHGAGLAKIIADAARGPAPRNPGMDERSWHSRSRQTAIAAEWDAEQRKVPTIATGNVAVTSAGVLPFKGIIHAVGPVWEDGTFGEGFLLARVHERACEAASQRGWTSIAFPAISCGLFRFPAEKAAPYAISGVKAFDFLDVRFYLVEDAHVSAWTTALDTYGPER